MQGCNMNCTLSIYLAVCPVILPDSPRKVIWKLNLTGSTLVLHCCKAHAKMNTKMGNSTPCKIVTPENFSSKVCTRNYVMDGNYCANFGEKRFSQGFSPSRWNVTPLWGCLLCAFRALQLPPEAWLRLSLKHGSVTLLTVRPSGHVILRSFGDAGYMPPKAVSIVWLLSKPSPWIASMICFVRHLHNQWPQFSAEIFDRFRGTIFGLVFKVVSYQTLVKLCYFTVWLLVVQPALFLIVGLSPFLQS